MYCDTMAKKQHELNKMGVQAAIGNYVLSNYQRLKIIGRKKPNTITQVLATIQNPDSDFTGIGKYDVYFDIYGSSTDAFGNVNENEHYTARNFVKITASPEEEPIPEIEGDIILTKQM